MKSPGITVRPLINLAGTSGFNEVFFDNVRVPRSGLLGELNRGWYMATTTLDFERSNVSTAAVMRRALEELTAFCRESKSSGDRLIDRPPVRHRLADLWIDVGVTRLMSYRVVTMQERGLVPNHEASVVKVFNSECNQRLARAGIQVLGLHGQLEADSPHARLRGRFERSYLTSLGSTIAAGTSEIQRNIIASRGLGLPRY
jgi:alkylation response protein AidB-like acyl-CoA dehydrogenase